MSILILLGLVVMWAVVLVPMWLRRHDEVEEARSVDRFVSAMHTLSRRETKVDPKRYGLASHRARGLEVHVSGASADGQKPSRRPNRKRAVTAADRRRRTLLVLLALTVFTLALAVLLGGMMIWAVQLVVDAVLAAFVYYSRRCAKVTAQRRPARPQPTARPVAKPTARPAARPAPPRRYVEEVGHSDERYVDNAGYDDERFEPVAVPAPARTAQAAQLFDQTIDDDRLTRQVPVAAEYEPAAAASFYDQDAAPAPRVVEFQASQVVDRDADTAAWKAGELFDQNEPEVRIIASPSQRDVMKDPLQVALSEQVEAADAGSADIGSRPWEPVAVPKPSYATKPVAPPRRTRAPIMEPLLPPIETAAEMDPVDDLEEILDRRWAVND